MKKTLSIMLLAAGVASAATSTTVAPAFAAMIATPAKTGTCKKSPDGQTCRWKSTKNFSSVNSLTRGKDYFVYIVNDPTFELGAFGPGQQPTKNGWMKVTQGALKGVYVRKVYFPTARHRQFEIRSAAAYSQEAQ